MIITSFSEMKVCDNNFIKMNIFFQESITHNDIIFLANNHILIHNSELSLPYFKIIHPHYTIRGSIGNTRITIFFNSSDRPTCKKFFSEILDNISLYGSL